MATNPSGSSVSGSGGGSKLVAEGSGNALLRGECSVLEADELVGGVGLFLPGERSKKGPEAGRAVLKTAALNPLRPCSPGISGNGIGDPLIQLTHQRGSRVHPSARVPLINQGSCLRGEARDVIHPTTTWDVMPSRRQEGIPERALPPGA